MAGVNRNARPVDVQLSRVAGRVQSCNIAIRVRAMFQVRAPVHQWLVEIPPRLFKKPHGEMGNM
jgi:hypothetical protein